METRIDSRIDVYVKGQKPCSGLSSLFLARIARLCAAPSPVGGSVGDGLPRRARLPFPRLQLARSPPPSRRSSQHCRRTFPGRRAPNRPNNSVKTQEEHLEANMSVMPTTAKAAVVCAVISTAKSSVNLLPFAAVALAPGVCASVTAASAAVRACAARQREMMRLLKAL